MSTGAGANVLHPYSRAAIDARALKNAAAALFEGGGPVKQFPNVKQGMTKILTGVGDLQYLGYLLKISDYRVALSYLTSFILVQQASEPIWYEMQKKVVQFMFNTADRGALAYVRGLQSNHEEGPNKFPNMLDRFRVFALAQNDAQMASMMAQLQNRM